MRMDGLLIWPSMEKELILSDPSALRDRWKTEEGRKLFTNALSQRFFLNSDQKKIVCSGENLISDFRGINLSSFELREFLLFDTDFRWADFSHSSVTGPFQDTDLSFSSFEKSHIESTNFWKTVAVQCKFDGSEFRDTVFEEVHARDDTFRNVVFDNVKFFRSDLRGAIFEGASFRNCVFYMTRFDAEDRDSWIERSEGECRFEKIDWSQG